MLSITVHQEMQIKTSHLSGRLVSNDERQQVWARLWSKGILVCCWRERTLVKNMAVSQTRNRTTM